MNSCSVYMAIFYLFHSNNSWEGMMTLQMLYYLCSEKQVVVAHSLQLSQMPVPPSQCQGAARVELPPQSPLPRQGSALLVWAPSLSSTQVWGSDRTCWWSSGHQMSRRLGHLHHRARVELHESSSPWTVCGSVGSGCSEHHSFPMHSGLGNTIWSTSWRRGCMKNRQVCYQGRCPFFFFFF